MSLFNSRLILCLVPLLIALVSLTATAAQNTPHGRFVVVSDLHAFACNDGSGGPCAAPPAVCGPSPRALACSPSHIDTDACLFDSFIEDLACTQQGNTDFVIIPGDWIAHTYGHSAGQESLKLGIIKTQTERIAQQLPNALIIPALGNNDAYEGDYNLEPCLKADPANCSGNEGKFLRDTLVLWRPLIDKADEVGTACVANPASGTDYLEESFIKGGYYSFSNPYLPNNCTLVLNTVLLLERYVSGGWHGAIKAHGTAAADQQLSWLEDRLEFARNPPDGSPPRRVWMIYHVPPGADPYGSADHDSPSMMFSTASSHDYSARFANLLKTYDDVIEAGFAGHTHMDSFRVAHQPGSGTQPPRSASWLRVAPSLTPNHHSDHGGYQWYEYQVNSSTTTISNYYSRHIKLDMGESWEREYAWSQTYCQPCALDNAGLDQVYTSLRDTSRPSHSHDKRHYIEYYGESGATQYCTGSTAIQCADDWPWYVCAIGNLETAEYAACAAALAPATVK